MNYLKRIRIIFQSTDTMSLNISACSILNGKMPWSCWMPGKQKLTEIVEAAAQKEAAMGKNGAPHHLAELELLARAQKDWYYAMMSYIMGGDSDAEEESK